MVYLWNIFLSHFFVPTHWFSKTSPSQIRNKSNCNLPLNYLVYSDKNLIIILKNRSPFFTGKKKIKHRNELTLPNLIQDWVGKIFGRICIQCGFCFISYITEAICYWWEKATREFRLNTWSRIHHTRLIYSAEFWTVGYIFYFLPWEIEKKVGDLDF